VKSCGCGNGLTCRRHLRKAVDDAVFEERQRTGSSPLKERWGEGPLKMGWAAVPGMLLANQHRLGLNSPDMMVLIHLIWRARTAAVDLKVSQSSIAQQLGINRSNVSRSLKNIEKAGLIDIDEVPVSRRGKDVKGYSLTPLVRRLNEFAKRVE
jgi:DNA-binding MarR family transcriptional regulator